MILRKWGKKLFPICVVIWICAVMETRVLWSNIMAVYSVSVQEGLAVVYAPSSPRVYTIYEPVIRLKGQAKTVVTQRPFSSKEVQSVSLEHNALRSLLPTETQGLQNVLHKIGGTGTFVFLFAQVRSRRLFPGLEVQHVVNGGISTPHTVFLQSMSIYSSPAET